MVPKVSIGMGRNWGYGIGSTSSSPHPHPVYVEIKLGVDPVKVCKYPISLEAKKGIILCNQSGTHLCCLLRNHTPMTIDQSRIQEKLIKGLLTNTPQYQTIYPAQLIVPDRQWYTVLELKDAFFSLPWAPKSQLIVFCLRMA